MPEHAPKPLVEKIPTVRETQEDIARLVATVATVSDKIRIRLTRHCQLDDAQILGMVQGAQAILIEAHERMLQ